MPVMYYLPIYSLLFCRINTSNVVGLCFLQVSKPLHQVLSSLVDQEAGQQIDNHNLSSDDLQRPYTVEEFEVRILEPERSGGPWETKATIPMQSSEHALTVRVVTLLVS